MFKKPVYLTWALLILLMTGNTVYAGNSKDARLINRGQYLVSTSGCNDCHTPGYAQADGKIPAEHWLVGSPVGFSGPWGTTYPANLRLLMQSLSETQWLSKARSPMRPPMPWFSLRDMTDQDLRAIYAFVRSLGAQGEPAPAYAPPGIQVSTPYFDFVPKNLPKQQAMK
jgi:mono/diheme cytochrome c family protein